jgi:AcrR family transcriptional regulator
MRTYAGKTLDERRAERRERLLDAGLELFGTRGYAQTTIEQICACARLNPRYFYEEFETREALLGEVYERHVRTVAERVREAIEAAPRDPRARLEVGLRAFLDGSLADERAARVNYFEVVGVSPELERLRRRILGEYAELIAGQLRELAGEAPLVTGAPRLAAVALAGATDGLIIDWLSGERGYDREAILATLLDIFGLALDQRRE